MTAQTKNVPNSLDNREFFRGVLKTIYLIMAEAFEMHKISVTPIGADGSRLSIPVKIEGLDSEDRQIIYFGKILGGSDIMTERTFQLFKNIYLQMNSREPLFDFTHSAKEMAKHQFEGLSKMYDIGIPTAKPFGYYPLVGGLWLFVAEFLDMGDAVSGKKIKMEQLEEAFQHLRKMHRKKVFHGDIKPENFIFSDQVYIMDVGHLLEDAPQKEKRAYDLACMIASFLEFGTPEAIVKLARKNYPGRDLKRASDYLDLIDKRPDFRLSAVKIEKLIRLLQK
ncbi:MAG TPA: hypothetical protein VMW85_07045 [Methanomassiliicoccales archaeon]|nr:hypothetical protein [Methanomassiliicoccales archaeon]